jgi:hypothetical protein
LAPPGAGDARFATERPNEIERLTVKTTVYDQIIGTDVVVEYPRIGDPRTVPDSVGQDFLFEACERRFPENLRSSWRDGPRQESVST